jgi:GTP cyclohydrolase IA
MVLVGLVRYLSANTGFFAHVFNQW